MSKTPERPDPQEVERLEVQRLLTQLEHGREGVAPTPRASTRPRPRPRQTSAAIALPDAARPSAGSVWGRVAVGAALVVGMTQWPYANACGLPLAGYLAASAGVLVVGLWAAGATWRARMGFAHVVALIIVFASAALAAEQVILRMGYSPVEVAWRCSGSG